MAPILKEADASVSTATAAPATPHSKPASESATRPQPVALEIPVTVNGARTIDGSDKRVPFSESTQTVLVFPHGAVVRIATPLAAGQLVFLTNEKSKKEVVCQVVKSKSTGSAAAYVELQFTEASAGFWGLSVPSGAPAPAASRPGPVAVTPKVAAPSAPPTSKPPVAAKPLAPAVIPAPAINSTVPPAPAASHNVAPATQPHPPSPAVVAAPLTAAALPTIPEPVPVSPPAAADSAPHAPATTPQPSTPAPTHSAPPLSPLHDYSKQIDALFTKSQPTAAPTVLESHHTQQPPNTDELKQQAARLQEQLSSLLFTETHPASPTSPKPQVPVTEVPNKLPQVGRDAPKTAPIEGKTASSILAEEEVKIPSWLAPLSQSAEAIVASDTAEIPEASSDASPIITSEESHEAIQASTPSHAQTAVIGGQLLGGLAAPAGDAASGGLKKGLLIGVAATALIAAAAWYFYQNHSASTPVATTSATNSAPASASLPATNSEPLSSPPTPAPNHVVSPAPSNPPAKKNAQPTPAAEVQPRENRPVSKTPEAAQEAPKPALGDVHLAAPVVSHKSNSPADSSALSSIDTNSQSAPADPLAAAATSHNDPVAPLPVGGDVQQARLIKSVPPQYPSIAKAQRVSGKVLIDALIDKSGNVANAKVISGPPLLYTSAVDAVKQWKYSPALLDGEPTSMHLTVTVEFRAQ